MSIHTSQLVITESGRTIIVPLTGEQTLGRPTKKTWPDIPVRSGVVSRKHARLVTDESGTSYEDLESLNGTLLNGAPVAPGTAVRLKSGDLLRIHGPEDESGDLDVLIRFEEVHPRTEPAAGLSPAQQEAAPSSAPRNVISSAAPQKALSSAAPRNVVSSDAPRSAVSSAAPQSADRPAAHDGPALSIDIFDRTVGTPRAPKVLLRDISMVIPSGSMVLILGGSGAGKTTFVNAVMGYEPANARILFGGVDLYEHYDKMKYEVGYVPQQDLLRMNDTVYNTLFNAAQMKLPAKYKDRTLNVHLDETLDLLGLSPQRDSLVGKLSGGQRKRLSIAVEYIGNPSLFFLDEPDSGLDGTMAEQLMRNLRDIADLGKIVMVISHSPDRAFDLFDKVIVLTKDSVEGSGHLAFYGSPREALSYFDVDSLEHIVRRVNRTDEGGEGLADYYIDKYKKNREIMIYE